MVQQVEGATEELATPDPRITSVTSRVIARALLIVAGLITGLGVLLAVAAWTEDAAIESTPGRANAEVVSVSLGRTLVRFQTPDGAVHIPQTGVLYPDGLAEGQVVRVEYDADNPELVRVAGRDARLTLLPVGSMVLAVWAITLPLWWWLRTGHLPLPALTRKRRVTL